MLHLDRGQPSRTPLVGLVAALLVLASCGEDTPQPMEPTPPTNAAPVANAGPNQTVSAGLAVRLDGSASSDADSDALTYAWSITAAPAGSAAALDDATAEQPTFVPDEAGAYTIELMVNDGTEDSAADQVTINAEDNTAEETVGAGGGTIVSTDGAFELEVPAGALAADTEISVTMVPEGQLPSEFDGLVMVDAVIYDLQPSGLQFSSPATVTIAGPEGVIDESDAFGVVLGSPFIVSDGPNGLEVEPAGEIEAEVGWGDADAATTATIDHFSTMVRISSGIRIEARGVPEVEEVGATFDISVRATTSREESIVGNPTQIDASSSPIAPQGTFDGTLDGGGATNAYSCTAVGEGTYRAEVDLVYELEIDGAGWIAQQLTAMGDVESRVTLTAPIDCNAAPAPPPSSFTSLTFEESEAIATLHATVAGTVYGVAGDNGLSLFDDNGLVIREILQPGGAFAALIGLLGSTDAAGQGPVFGFGPDGIFGVGQAQQDVLERLDISIPGVTDNNTSVTDGFIFQVSPSIGLSGSQPTSHEGTTRYAFAQFEDRNVLFLEDDGSGGLEVVGELADAFVQNGVSIFGDDRPLSVWIGPDGFDEDHPMLVLTIADDTFGDLNVVSLENGVAVRTIVPDFTSIIEPRRLRCDDETGICGMSSFRTHSFGGIYTFRWDGQDGVTRLTPRLSFAPVGIDVVNTGSAVLMTGTDTKRFVNGAFQYEFRVVEYGLNGGLQRNDAFLVPEGCIDPFHAMFRRRIADFGEVLISCKGDAQTSGGVFAATYEFPSS